MIDLWDRLISNSAGISHQAHKVLKWLRDNGFSAVWEDGKIEIEYPEDWSETKCKKLAERHLKHYSSDIKQIIELASSDIRQEVDNEAIITSSTKSSRGETSTPGWVHIYSEVLDEKILVARAMSYDPDINYSTKWTYEESNILEDLNEKTRKQIINKAHTVKEVFPGATVDGMQ